MNELRNPYIAGAPVIETSMFFGREDIFAWIENSLTGKFVDHILVLHGQRRVGKTSVLKQIPNFLSEKYIQIFFDLQGRTNTTLDRFLWWMASEIVRTLNRKVNIDLPRPSRDQFTDPDVFINDFIFDLQPILANHILLLTFDEFDTLDRTEIQDSLARPLISFLRRIFEVKGLNFIFSIGSSGSKLENMQAAYTDFFKTALYREVSFLTKDDCTNLITKPVEGVITYQPEAIRRITEITSGHPYFTQLTCHELFSQCQKTGKRIIKGEDVETILDDVIERGTVNLKFVWDEATNLEKWILSALGKKDGIPIKDISAVLKSQGVRFVESDLNSAILHLRDKDVLTQDNHLLIYLMKLWLERNRPMDRVREELIETNPIADRYIEIGDEYRERSQWEDALNSYQQALSAQANNLAALINIGGIHLENNNYQQARASFEKALQVDNEHIAARQGFFQAQIALGDQARKRGAIVEAIDAYQMILNLTPMHHNARQNLAEIYKEQAETYLTSGDDQQAIERLQLAIELMPEDDSLKLHHQTIITEKKASLVKSWMDKADRALKRKRWDEASHMAEEALKVDPQDQNLQQRVAEIKDAPRQEKLKTYRFDAENAIAKGDYNRAITALETAVLLAPEDSSLADWLQATRSDEQHAQIRMYKTQAEEAQATGAWESAITAWETALKLDPANESLAQALTEAKAAQHGARLKSLREQTEQARQERRWEDAITAVQVLLELTPDDSDARVELDALKTAQRQVKLDALLQEAEDAAREENWGEAVSAWEAYLEEVPEGNEKLTERLAHARKYAQINTDYTEAQEHLHKKQYNRAINKLQGIITQDPTYKATSRLLTEAVEDSRQRKPIWKSPWLITTAAVTIIIILGLIFRQELMGFITTHSTPGSENSIEQQESVITPSVLIGEALLQESQVQSVFNAAFLQDDEPYAYLLEHLNDQTPIFNEDFSDSNQAWGTTSEGNQISSLIQDDQLVIVDHFDGSGNHPDSDIAGVALSIDKMNIVDNYLLSFNFAGNEKIESVNLNFSASATGDKGYQISIKHQRWELIRLSDNSLVGQGNITSSPADRSSNLIILVVQDSLAHLFINNETVFEFNDLTREDNHIRIVVVASDEGGFACFDNFQIWDLEGIYVQPQDLNQAAVANWDTVRAIMEGQPFTFNDDFSKPNQLWDDYWSTSGNGSLDRLISDGHLRIPDVGGEFGFPLPVRAKDFLAYIEFAPQGDYELFNFHFRTVASPEAWYIFSLHGQEGGYSIDYRDETIPDTINTLHQGNLGPLNGKSLFKLVVIAVEEDFSIFWIEDEQEVLLFHLSEANIDGDGLGFYIRSDRDNVMNIDTILFWDLTGVDLDHLEHQASETVTQELRVEEIINTDPDWMDDFSTIDAGWGTVISEKTGEHPVSEFVVNDMLEFPASSSTQHTRIPVGGSEFILSLEISPQTAFSSFEFNFRIEDEPQPSGYRFKVEGSDGSYSIEIFDDETNATTVLKSGTLDNFELHKAYELMILASEDNLRISWDGFEVFASNDAVLHGADNHIRVSNLEETGTILNVDNIRFWNLDGIQIVLEDEQDGESSPLPTTPEWVTDFAEPILSQISSTPPSLEDDFSTRSSAWKIASDWRISIDNDEMFIQSGSVNNQLITFYDYVLQVDLRIIQIGNHGIHFTNGSSIECDFYLEKYESGGFYYRAIVNCGTPSSKQIMPIAEFPRSKKIYNLLLIVKGSKIGFYIDGIPLAYIDNEDFSMYRGENLEVGLYSWTSQSQAIDGIEPISAAFSNFKVWNITHLEIP